MCKLSHLSHPAWQLKHLFAQWVNCLLNGLIAHHTPWVCSCAYGLSQISLPLPGLFFFGCCFFTESWCMQVLVPCLCAARVVVAGPSSAVGSHRPYNW